MLHKLVTRFAFSILALCTASQLLAAEPVLKPNDRVVFLGNTLIEREQKSGHWETALLLSRQGSQPTFRNLGWDGDTVWADSRGIFDPPAAGYKRMLELVNELKPTVIVLGYGGVEAFPDETRRDQFEAQYRKLVSDLSSTNAQFVHLSPMHLDRKAFPVQSAEAKAQIEAYNKNSTELAQTIQNIAKSTDGLFVDLQKCQQQNAYTMWTTNGLHLTEEAYAITGSYIAEALGGETQAIADAPHAEEIRQLVIEKNRLFFHRWRPQNITYLLGFRKHEQGNNAVEIAEYDPLIVALKEKIQKLLRE